MSHFSPPICYSGVIEKTKAQAHTVCASFFAGRGIGDHGAAGFQGRVRAPEDGPASTTMAATSLWMSLGLAAGKGEAALGCAQAGGGYHLRAHPRWQCSYRHDEIDRLVAYIAPEVVWYVFPPRAFHEMKSMCLFSHRGRKRADLERCGEAWAPSMARNGRDNVRGRHLPSPGFRPKLKSAVSSRVGD